MSIDRIGVQDSLIGLIESTSSEEPRLPEETITFKEEQRSSDKEILQQYDIRIEFLSGRGCVVIIGCKRIAFEDNQKAMEAINAYVENPYEESKKWIAIFNQ